MTIREYLKTLLQGVKTYVDEKIVKSDWNVNDENDPAYIKNRPFGESLEDVILIEEQSIEGFTDWEEGNYGVTTSIQMDLVIGDSYTVIWDGTTYDNLICFDDEGCPTIGAVYKDYTNYPFGVYIYEGKLEFHTNSAEDAHTVSISKLEKVINRLDKKYLPFYSEMGEFLNLTWDDFVDNKYVIEKQDCFLNEDSFTIEYLRNGDSEPITSGGRGYSFEVIYDDNGNVIGSIFGTLEVFSVYNGVVYNSNTDSYDKVDTCTFEADRQIDYVKVEKLIYHNKLEKEYIEGLDEISGGVQSDWNVNDETSSSYIQNRPFYEESNIETIEIASGDFTFGTYYHATVENVNSILFAIGNEITVNIDNVEYTYTATSVSGTKVRYNTLGSSHYIEVVQNEETYNLTMYCSTSSVPTTTVVIMYEVKTIHKLDEKYLSENIQSDWSINDETDISYIKNRPFYEGEFEQVEVLYTKSYMRFTNGNYTLTGYSLAEDNIYIVNWDGYSYTVHCTINEYGNYCAGNTSLSSDGGTDTGEPFCLFGSPSVSNTIYVYPKSGIEIVNTVEIVRAEQYIKTLDPIYLPDNIETLETTSKDLVGAINEIVNSGVSVGDTLPIESQFYWDKDEDIPEGYVEVTPPFANPNLLINGDFQVWQRGTTASNFSNSYVADRWLIKNAKGNTSLVEKSTDVPSGELIKQSLHITETLTENSYLRYMLDDGDTLKGTYTLSFWYKTSVAFNSYIYENNAWVHLGKLSTLNTWTKATFTFTATSVTQLSIIHAMSAGNTYITGVKLECGDLVTPFIPRPYAEELVLCQRYFQQITGGGVFGIGYYGNLGVIHSLAVPLRIAPSITYNGSLKAIRDGSDEVAVSSISSVDYSMSNSCIWFICKLASAIGACTFYRVHNGNIFLDAEIY